MTASYWDKLKLTWRHPFPCAYREVDSKDGGIFCGRHVDTWIGCNDPENCLDRAAIIPQEPTFD